jgi:hypothetical protein
VVGRDSRNLAVVKGTAHAWLNEHECVEVPMVTHSSAFLRQWVDKDYDGVMPGSSDRKVCDKVH